MAPHKYDNACDTDCNICGEVRTTQHKYDNTCDTSCNVCGEVRTTQHKYDNTCDTDCNICGEVRMVPHKYDNTCDTDCNICGYVRSITHNYEWVIDKQETCGESGLKHEECTICHAKRNENTVISATDVHKYDNDKDNLCNICGCKRLYLCSSCNGSGKEVFQKKCTNCTDGITGYTNCSVCNGSGKYGTGTSISCALCGGSGSVKDAFGKWVSCFACGGDGWGMSYPTCYSCNGAKKYPKYCAECAGDGTVPTEGDCKNCKGAGKVEAYNLSFNANGGSGAPNDQTILGYTNTLVTGMPTKTGYVFKGWKLLYEDTIYQPGDVYNAGENTLYAIWHKKCENCNGSGSVSSTWDCSTCDGEGRRRYCTSCGSYNITKHVTGYYGTYYSCSSCGNTSTSTTSCSSCGGDGVSTGTVSCSHCSGAGCLKEDDKATNLPVVESNDKSSITLAFIEGYEYSLDGINWQSDTTFNGLESGVEYTFYQRVRITNNAVCGVASEGRKVIILSAGDLDEDDDITDWDGVLLARYLAGWSVGLSDSVLDIDGDGEVTDWDGVMFDRYLAGWSVEVFVGTGKAVSIYSITYTDDKNAENSNPTTYKTGQKLKLLPLEKEHYRFDGWYYMGETITELSGNENGDIILIAQWTPVKYNVTYLDTRNNTNSLNPKYITADDGTLNLFDLPATNGYAFDGWVDSSGRKVTSIVATGQDIKLTATWVFDSVAIIDTKHDYNTKKYEVSYTYASEMGATGNFTVTYQVSIKNVWDYQITTGSVWFQLVDKNGNYAGSSFSASVVFLPVGETYVWEYEMNAVPKGEYTLIISD